MELWCFFPKIGVFNLRGKKPKKTHPCLGSPRSRAAAPAGAKGFPEDLEQSQQMANSLGGFG